MTQALNRVTIFSLQILFPNISIANDTTVENTSGLDSTILLTSFLSIFGLSSWNHETDDWREHSYEAGLYMGAVLLNPSFQLIQFDDFFDDNNLGTHPFHYLHDSEEELIIVGADLIWQIAFNLELGIRLKQNEPTSCHDCHDD